MRENRLRRMADRQGLKLQKSRGRDHRALDYGSYWLLNVETEGVVLGGEYGTDLDEIEAALDGAEQ